MLKRNKAAPGFLNRRELLYLTSNLVKQESVGWVGGCLCSSLFPTIDPFLTWHLSCFWSKEVRCRVWSCLDVYILAKCCLLWHFYNSQRCSLWNGMTLNRMAHQPVRGPPRAVRLHPTALCIEMWQPNWARGAKSSPNACCVRINVSLCVENQAR